MQLFINKKIGKRAYPFVVEGSDLHECVMQAEHLSFDDVSECGVCGSDQLRLTARVATGGFKYVSVRCQACRADLTFGRTKADASVFFLRRNENGKLDWHPYDKTAVE